MKKYRSLLSQRQYLKLLLANVINRFGDSIDAIAYSWIMYEVTGSESMMAAILGLNYLPSVLLQPFCGVLTDRINKKRIMVITDLLRCLIVGILALLYVNDRLTPAVIVVLTLLTSAVEAFRVPAGGAIVPLLLAPEYYTLGKGAQYSLANAANLAGLILAGGIIAAVGTVGALWIDALTFVLSACLIAWIRYREMLPEYIAGVKQVAADFGAGLSFLRGNRTMQMICLLGLLINFGLMPLSVFQTPYVCDYLNMGPEVLSYIKILMTAGMISGAVLAPKVISRSHAGPAAAAGMAMGAALAVMYFTAGAAGVVLKMSLLTISMFLVGAGGGVINVIVGSDLMRVVPEAMMGRMSGLNSAIMTASMPAGAFLCSAMALLLDCTQLLLAFGIITILAYLGLLLSGRLRCLDEHLPRQRERNEFG